MIDEKLFIKIAKTNFHIFDVTTIQDIETIYKLYPRKEMIREFMKNKIIPKNNKVELPEKIIIEMYLLLSEFCINNKIEPLEACALFKIISDLFELIKQNRNKFEIYENFKKFVLTFAMNRFSKQIGVLKKETVYLITTFFIEYIYKRFNMIHFCLTKKEKIILETKESINYDLPKVEDASIIKPNLTSGTVVRPNDNDYNIYNSIPNVIDNVKEEPSNNYDDIARIKKDDLKDVSEKLNDYNIYSKEVKVDSVSEAKPTVKIETEKTNVNVDPDKVVINNNNVISDDEFFDDFFGDD